MRHRKADGVSPDERPIVVVIDELAEVLASGDRKRDAEANALFRRFLQVGRAAGFSVIAATQRPSADLIDPNARSQFGYLACFRVQRPSDAYVILGDVPKGIEPWSIPAGRSYAGIGFLTSEAGGLVKFRADRLTDGDLFLHPGSFEVAAERDMPGPALDGSAELHGEYLIAGLAASYSGRWDATPLLPDDDDGATGGGPVPTHKRRG